MSPNQSPFRIHITACLEQVRDHPFAEILRVPCEEEGTPCTSAPCFLVSNSPLMDDHKNVMAFYATKGVSQLGLNC